MKQYMRKHQTLEPIDPGVTDRSTMPFIGENHGTSGPVRTSFNDTFLPIEADIIKACDEVAGLTKKPLDPWSGDHIGFFNTLGSVARSGPNKSRRSYAARGYYEPNAHRPNLHVYCEATVLRIVLEGNTAVGAEVDYSGHCQVFKAKREVLLCGGAIHSPQLLELSGIGNKDILSAAGVECKIDLPGVGENFQDHVLYAVAYELQPGNFSLDGIYQPEAMEAAQKALVEQGGGPLTCISSAQGFLPYKSLVSPEELQETVKSIEATEATTPFQRKQLDKVIEHLKSDKSANLQVVVIPATVNADAIADQSKAWPPPKPDQPMGVTLAMCLQYPASRGSVHIKSPGKLPHCTRSSFRSLRSADHAQRTDVSQQPAIDPAYNTHPADVAVLAAGVTFLDKVAQSGHLADKLAKRVHPAASNDLSTIAGAKPVVEDWCFGEYHVAGTCAMGDVVDGRLRVKGVKALRVVDASVFANHVSGNICSSVYAVAEKAADMIKEDWDYAALAQVKGKTID